MQDGHLLWTEKFNILSPGGVVQWSSISHDPPLQHIPVTCQAAFKIKVSPNFLLREFEDTGSVCWWKKPLFYLYFLPFMIYFRDQMPLYFYFSGSKGSHTAEMLERDLEFLDI